MDHRQVTQQQERSQNKAHIAKLASIGKLTSSIIHEIRNPLTTIRLHADALLLSESLEENRLKEHASEIINSVTFINKIIKNIAGLSSSQAQLDQKIDLKDLIQEALDHMNQKIKENSITLQNETRESGLIIQGDRYALRQVFINLFSNACDAMKTAKKRILNVQCRQENKVTIIDISDTGGGIRKDLLCQNKIFDAFFTTKEAGQGMGLGLSICKEIIEIHRGKIMATNQKDGVVFSVKL